MELSYTYWQEKDGWLLGYLNDYPAHWTQGKTLKELEEMLIRLVQKPGWFPHKSCGFSG